jgi:hypothetical protein
MAGYGDLLLKKVIELLVVKKICLFAVSLTVVISGILSPVNSFGVSKVGIKSGSTKSVSKSDSKNGIKSGSTKSVSKSDSKTATKSGVTNDVSKVADTSNSSQTDDKTVTNSTTESTQAGVDNEQINGQSKKVQTNDNDTGSTKPMAVKGDGTKNHPLLISTANELKSLASHVNSNTMDEIVDSSVSNGGYYIELAKDISLASITGPTKGNWVPIGTGNPGDGSPVNPFSGIFNGAGHTISNLYISSTAEFQGLFGYNYKATVTDIGLIDSNITGGIATGGIVGYNNNSTISSSYNTGQISGTDQFTGGIAGGNDDNSHITSSYNTGQISGTGQYTGGIAGLNYYKGSTKSKTVNHE